VGRSVCDGRHFRFVGVAVVTCRGNANTRCFQDVLRLHEHRIIAPYRARESDLTAIAFKLVICRSIDQTSSDHERFVQTTGIRLERRFKPSISSAANQRIPAAMAGTCVHTVFQVHALAANPGQDLSATDQTLGARDGMARRTDSRLDRSSVVGCRCGAACIRREPDNNKRRQCMRFAIARIAAACRFGRPPNCDCGNLRYLLLHITDQVARLQSILST